MLRGAIFDMDGTLLDSMSVWDNVGENYLRSIGYEPRENFAETIKDLSLYQASCYCKSEYGIKLSFDEIMDGVNAMVEGFYRYEAKLKQGADEFLRRLRESGVKMCIATATDKHLAEAALARCGITSCFCDILTCNSVGHGKDEPIIYRLALESLGTKKSETIVFEDALYALKTAHDDGFITAAVFDEHERAQDELKMLSDFYIKNFKEINAFWAFAQAM